jgi:hypothetical protein
MSHASKQRNEAMVQETKARLHVVGDKVFVPIPNTSVIRELTLAMFSPTMALMLLGHGYKQKCGDGFLVSDKKGIARRTAEAETLAHLQAGTWNPGRGDGEVGGLLPWEAWFEKEARKQRAALLKNADWCKKHKVTPDSVPDAERVLAKLKTNETWAKAKAEEYAKLKAAEGFEFDMD